MKHDHHSLSDFLELSAEILSKQVSAIRLFTPHDPSFGQACENLLREFFKNHIPTPFNIGTGFIHDPLTGRSSRQCDIIIYDTTKGPVYFRNGDLVIVSPTSAQFIIEVKGNISSIGQIKSSLINLDSVKQFGYKIRWALLTFSSRITAKAVTKALSKHPIQLDFQNYPDLLISLSNERWLFNIWSEFKALRRFVLPPETWLGFNFLFAKILAWLQGTAQTEFYIDFERKRIVGLHEPVKIGAPLSQHENLLLDAGWLLERGQFQDCLQFIEKNALGGTSKGFEYSVRCQRYLGDSDKGLELIGNSPHGISVDKKMYFELLVMAKEFLKAKELIDQLGKKEKDSEKEYWYLNDVEILIYLGKHDEALIKIKELEHKLPQHCNLDIYKIWVLIKQKGIDSVDPNLIGAAQQRKSNADDFLFRNALIAALLADKERALQFLIKLQALSPLPISIYTSSPIFSEVFSANDFKLLRDL